MMISHRCVITSVIAKSMTLNEFDITVSTKDGEFEAMMPYHSTEIPQVGNELIITIEIPGLP